MNLTTQKRIAAKLLKCGVSRVRVEQTKEVGEAITRQDIRDLIKSGKIKKIQKKGTSRAKARQILKQKRRGRRRGAGSKKGKIRKKKDTWVSLVRAQRKILVNARESGMKTSDYSILYSRVKSGMFRSRKHLLSYMKERELLPAKGGKK